MKYGEDFIRAYRAFRESVDFGTGGILPELDSLIWCMLAGVPEVPADEDMSPDAPVTAIDQRVAILKAVFVEVNGDQGDEFIDRGLIRYDRASEMAKKLLKEEDSPEPDLD
ncbi:MAG: hypothetical protein JRJ86_11975 [Deltaproteobacteria bacterium]|nr:hypothetical protein [Deltaproteobacteria bacterium]MBW2117440.1 hypothetical protein [Deltaproteobacteria bacterium]MBW2343866.1 hypothetical protein [Deltaproteobacteria bacterium]